MGETVAFTLGRNAGTTPAPHGPVSVPIGGGHTARSEPTSPRWPSIPFEGPRGPPPGTARERSVHDPVDADSGINQRSRRARLSGDGFSDRGSARTDAGDAREVNERGRQLPGRVSVADISGMLVNQSVSPGRGYYDLSSSVRCVMSYLLTADSKSPTSRPLSLSTTNISIRCIFSQKYMLSQDVPIWWMKNRGTRGTRGCT